MCVWREQCGRDGVSAVWYGSMLAATTALNRSVDCTLHPFSDAVAVAQTPVCVVEVARVGRSWFASRPLSAGFAVVSEQRDALDCKVT